MRGYINPAGGRRNCERRSRLRAKRFPVSTTLANIYLCCNSAMHFTDTKKHLMRSAFLLWRHHPESNWGIKVLQTSALPLGYGAIWSGKRGSNPPPLPWQGSALPNELFPQYGASEWSRTTDTGIFSPLLYQLSYRGKNWRPEGGSNP